MCCSLDRRSAHALETAVTSEALTAQQNLGETCHQLFGHEALCLSDYVLGLVLLGTMQRIHKEEMRLLRQTQKHQITLGPLSDMPPHIAVNIEAHPDKKQIHTSPVGQDVRPSQMACGTHLYASSQTASTFFQHQQQRRQHQQQQRRSQLFQQEIKVDVGLEDLGSVSETDLRAAEHYKNYALCPFGWPMYVWIHRHKGKQSVP